MRDMNTTRTTCESSAAGDGDLQMWMWGLNTGVSGAFMARLNQGSLIIFRFQMSGLSCC